MTDSGDIPVGADPDEPAPGELDGAGRRKNGRESHGLWRAKKALRDANTRSRILYSGNTSVGRMNLEQRSALIRQAGGEEALTPTMRHSIDEIVRVKMLQTFTDSYLAELGPRIVNRRKKVLVPVIEQRLRLSDALQKHLATLEQAIAARKGLDQNDIAASWARSMRSLQNADERDAVEAELERRDAELRNHAAGMSTGDLEARAEALRREDPHGHRRRPAIEHQSPTDPQEAPRTE